MGMRQRLRGLVGIATTWGVGLSAIGTTLLVGGIAAGVIPGAFFGPREIIAVAVRNFVMGATAGVLFAMLLARGERRQTVATLSLRRVAGWGFLGLAIPAAIVVVTAPVALSLATLTAGIGAALSTATVKLARRTPSGLLSDESGPNALPREQPG